MDQADIMPLQPSKEPTDRTFREDINGMRALAVLGVVAFHFKLGPLRAGGFGGVDVFFVISGFLMMQIIAGRLERGDFSFVHFYQARVRRVVPALVTMAAGVLVAGFVLLNPLAYARLALRAAWSLPFLSNWLFAAQDPYFNPPNLNWLLHTWSLSVEAQFYLVFPVLLVLLQKTSRPAWRGFAVLATLAAASFAAMIWSSAHGHETWTFYMLWSRAWEFLAGGLCALALPHLRLAAPLRSTLHYGGIATIVATMLFVHLPAPWPSAATLAPVIGAAAVLLADHATPAWARCSATARLGAWSYSLYLWHWPVAASAAFLGYWSIPWRVAGVALSLGLAAASFGLIERWATDALWRSRRRLWTIAGPAFIAVLALAVTLSAATDRLEALRYAFSPTLLAKLRAFRAAEDDNKGGRCDRFVARSTYIGECRFGTATSNDTLVVGDSFAAQMTARYTDKLTNSGHVAAFVFKGGCSPFSETTRVNFAFPCQKWQDELYRYALASDFKRIVFEASWPEYKQGQLCLLTEPNCGLDLTAPAYDAALDLAYDRLAHLWKALRRQGKDVVVLDAIPYPGDSGDPLNIYARVAAGETIDKIEFSYADFAAIQAPATTRLRKAAVDAGASFVNPAPSICPLGKCPVVRDGLALYSDAYHVRDEAMKEPRFSILDQSIMPGRARSIPAD